MKKYGHFQSVLILILSSVFLIPISPAASATSCLKSFVYVEDNEMEKLETFVKQEQGCLDEKIKEGPEGYNLFTFALKSKSDLRIVELLLKLGMSPNGTDSLGRTAFAAMPEGINPEVVKLLVENGLNLKTEYVLPNGRSVTLLELAFYKDLKPLFWEILNRSPVEEWVIRNVDLKSGKLTKFIRCPSYTPGPNEIDKAPLTAIALARKDIDLLLLLMEKAPLSDTRLCYYDRGFPKPIYSLYQFVDSSPRALELFGKILKMDPEQMPLKLGEHREILASLFNHFFRQGRDPAIKDLALQYSDLIKMVEVAWAGGYNYEQLLELVSMYKQRGVWPEDDTKKSMAQVILRASLSAGKFREAFESQGYREYLHPTSFHSVFEDLAQQSKRHFDRSFDSDSRLFFTYLVSNYSSEVIDSHFLGFRACELLFNTYHFIKDQIIEMKQLGLSNKKCINGVVYSEFYRHRYPKNEEALLSIADPNEFKGLEDYRLEEIVKNLKRLDYQDTVRFVTASPK